MKEVLFVLTPEMTPSGPGGVVAKSATREEDCVDCQVVARK